MEQKARFGGILFAHISLAINNRRFPVFFVLCNMESLRNANKIRIDSSHIAFLTLSL